MLDELPRVSNRRTLPCPVQKEIAQQNSYVDTVKQGKEVVYAAPCEIEKPKVQPVPAAPQAVAQKGSA